MFDDVSVDTCKYVLICYVGRNMHGARHFVSCFIVFSSVVFTPRKTRLENQIGLVKMSLSVVACCVFRLVSWVLLWLPQVCPVFVLPGLVLFYSSILLFPFM